eukprot:gene10043-13501_t
MQSIQILLFITVFWKYWVKSSNYTIITIAGTTTSGYSGDNGFATAAALNTPGGLYVTTDSVIYIADKGNNRIRRIDSGTGIINTYAGTGKGSFSGDNSLANSSALRSPSDVWIDEANGILYIADTTNNRIRKVNLSTSIISTVCGTGLSTYNGDGMLATSTNIYGPTSVTTDTVGNFYFSTRTDNRVGKVTTSTGIMSNIAGYNVAGYNGDNMLAIYAKLNTPVAVRLNSRGKVYVSENNGNRIRAIDETTKIISTIAGTGSVGSASTSQEGIAATSTLLVRSYGICIDANDVLYFVESNRLRIIESSLIYTVAGNSSQGYSGDGMDSMSATMNTPNGYLNSITVTVSSPPLHMFSMKLELIDTTNFSAIILPSQLDVEPSILPLSTFDFSIYTYSISRYSLVVLLEGNSSSEYEIIYETKNSIQAISNENSMPAPHATVDAPTTTIVDILNVLEVTTNKIIKPYNSTLLTDFINLLKLYNSLESRNMVSTQSDMVQVYNSFRLSTSIHSIAIDENVTIMSPLNDMEYATSQEPTSISFPTNINYSNSLIVSYTLFSGKLLPIINSTFSNPIMVNISNSNSLKISNNSIVPIMSSFPYTQHYQLSNNHSDFNFTTICDASNYYKQYNFTCPGSKVILSHSCKGENDNITSFCPIKMPTCQLFDIGFIQTSNSNNCSLINYNNDRISCLCDININNNNNINNTSKGVTRRSLLPAEQVDDIVLNLVSMVTYIGNESPETFSSLNDFATAKGIERSLTVITMFSTFWIVGLFFVSFFYYKSKSKNIKYSLHQQQLDDPKVRVLNDTLENAKEILEIYFDEIIPKIYLSQPIIIRLINEVLGQHRFASVVSIKSGIENHAEQKYVDGIKLLTIQCMMMFMMAIFFDFQYPQDDGTCISYQTEITCLVRKSPFDESIPYCIWSNNNNNNNYQSSNYAPCQYNANTSSTTRVFVITIVLISFCTGLMIRPIDVLFYYLLAPLTSNIDKISNKVTKNTTMTAKLAHKLASLSSNKVFYEAQVRLDEYKQHVWTVRGEYHDIMQPLSAASIDESFNLRNEQNFKNYATKLVEDY